jgi:hypothetical protein
VAASKQNIDPKDRYHSGDADRFCEYCREVRAAFREQN